nr:hypothetical protein [Tanacetum cinerariifolium]
MFKVNFLMLFANVLGTADTMKTIVNLTVLRHTREDTYISGIDWCRFIHKCLQVIRQHSAIQNWTTTAMNRRQDLEIQEKVIGKPDFHREWIKSKLDQIEDFCSMIEEKISMIFAEKIALEDLLKRANAEFPNDEKVIELCEKYKRLSKESVFVEDFQAHIDDFGNNDNDGGGKNDVHGSDNVGKKKGSVSKDVVNAEKDGVNDVQEGEADVNEELEDMLNEETFTQWIEKNIDWVGEVIDCLYDAYYEKDLFVWPRTVQLISVVYGVNVVQEGEADVNEEPEHMLEEETFTQWIEKNIDWVGEVIDCLYGAYYEEDLFVWSRAVQPISVVCP